jgi:hypothetical protein
MTVRVLAACVTAGSAASIASAQAVSIENFEAAGTPWTANGVETLVNDGRGIDNQYLALPYMDFWAAEIRTEDARSGLLGDLTRYPRGLRVSFDMVTFRFHNFFGDDIDPNSRPIVFQLIDYGDPNDFTDDVSVWFEGPPIPATTAGWQNYVFTLPDPTQTALPAGWRGTGDEDPVTFEPRLPPSRTFTSVLRSVDEVKFTTFVPGYFYASSFWEIGYDNVRVIQPTPACACDINVDGQVSVQDIFDFLAAYFAGTVATADFNHDSVLSVQDIFDFLGCFFLAC